MIIEQGQCLMDFAIQHCGSATAIVAIAMLNNISVTEDVAAGTDLLLPPVVNQQVVNYFKTNNLIPATQPQKEKPFYNSKNEGIGYWAIGHDFIVS